MTKFLKLRAVAAAAGAFAALIVASPANAEVYSLSQQRLYNFSIGIFDINAGNPSFPQATTTVNTFQYQMNNKAEVNGTIASGGSFSANCNQDSCVNGSPVLDPLQAKVGAVTKGENDFTPQGLLPAGLNYSRADSVITSDQLTSGGLSLTDENQIAEVLLNSGGQANANATLLSTSSVTVNFTVSGISGTGNSDNFMTVDFDADLLQALGIAAPTGGGALVSSAVNTSFKLSRDGDVFNQVRWVPTGTPGSSCVVDAAFLGGGVTCTSVTDPFSLNRTISSSALPTVASQFQTGSFGIQLNGLKDGTYTFDLSTKVEVQVQQVPEPGTVALVGLALAGLGLASRRQKKHA